MEAVSDYLIEFFFVLTGLLMAYTGGRVVMDPNHPARFGTGLFWLILAATFALGQVIPYEVTGILILIMGALTLFNQVKVGPVTTASEEESQAHSDRLGNRIFIPVVSLALIAILLAQLTPLDGQAGIGIASILAILIGVLVTRSKFKTSLDEGDRMNRQVGTVGILPQLLAALGVIFTTAGVGEVISSLISGIVPAGSPLLGVTAYVLGMVVFSMIMGNTFAAFTVITAGVGIPFVIAQGADPVITGALAMTAGYCGTLMTPMAANFNALPVALLEMDNPNSVIKEQVPFALVMIVVHIFLMYFWAF